jgi:hypothetical protein
MAGLLGLQKARPCPGGKRFLHEHKTPMQAWDALDNAGWMEWYLHHTILSRKTQRGLERLRTALRPLTYYIMSSDDKLAWDKRYCNAVRALYPTPPPLRPQYRRKPRVAR